MIRSIQVFFVGFVVLFVFSSTAPLYAQLVEPPVQKQGDYVLPADQGVSNYLGGGIVLSDFGYGIKGTFAHVIAPLTQITFTTGITGIRYSSQQKVFNFSYFFGTSKSIVNKYNRVLGFPFMVGIKHRIFPRAVSDNFRFFLSVSGGPALALVFPYLNDSDGNGYRSIAPIRDSSGNPVQGPGGNLIYRFVEYKQGFFRALGDATTQLGAAGSVKIGIDFGKDFKSQPSLTLGYFFYYFSSGLQIMSPYKPVFDNNNNITGKEKFFGKKSYYGTPQITFTFSGWW